MLKLEATLIARMACPPWRTGWSLERGVDFVMFSRRPLIAVDAPINPARIEAAEPVSFITEDEGLAAGATVIRRYVSLAAQEAAAAPLEPVERPLTRAWSSVARKAPGS
jgi:hypothetical protein